MTTTSRRDFIKTSAAAAAGAVAMGPNLLAQSATLELTISGLCVLVKQKDGTLHLVLPTAAEHDATFGQDNIAGQILSLSPLPSGPVVLPPKPQCDSRERWFAKLSELYPKQTLITYPERQAPRRIASYLPLSGGAIELVTSDPKAVPGFYSIWDIRWDNANVKQLLVEVAVYRASIPAGPVTLTMTSMDAGQVVRHTFTATAGQTLSLSIRNDGPQGQHRNSVGFLRHFENFAGIFLHPPKQPGNPQSSTSCRTQPPGSPRLVAPSKALIEALKKRAHAKSAQTQDIRLGNRQVWIMTADDPICPIAFYDPA